MKGVSRPPNISAPTHKATPVPREIVGKSSITTRRRMKNEQMFATLPIAIIATFICAEIVKKKVENQKVKHY